MSPTFHDRRDAGRALATKLLRYAGRPDTLVLALPRGGVPVAFEVARALHAPLDLFLVRKLGVPGHEELALGAIATGGVRVLNPDVVDHLRIPPSTIDRIADDELRELRRRERAYRDDRPPPDVAGRTVILIDDGLATGATMRAAARAVRLLHPARLVVAVPTASPETCDDFRQDPAIDEVVCAVTPDPFYAVGLSYEDFAQTTDQEVADLLAHSPHTPSSSSSPPLNPEP
jgi:predicted phosphoribosyltransferase